jgi:hypothetical protein
MKDDNRKEREKLRGMKSITITIIGHELKIKHEMDQRWIMMIRQY